MQGTAYYNGFFGTRNEIRIPLSDRSVFFGDGVYDLTIGKNGIPLLLDEHIERLFSSAAIIGLKHPFDHYSLRDKLLEIVDRSGLTEYTLYFQISRNSETRVHAAEDEKVNLLVTVDPYRLPKEAGALKLVTAEDMRYRYCNAKTINLLPAVIASTNAKTIGADETVFLRGNTVTECAHSNVSILKNGMLFTHPLSEHILPGITRSHLIKAAKVNGIRVIEEPFSLCDMYSADEIIVTSTTKLISCAVSIDGIAFKGRDKEKFDVLAKTLFEDVIGE